MRTATRVPDDVEDGADAAVEGTLPRDAQSYFGGQVVPVVSAMIGWIEARQRCDPPGSGAHGYAFSSFLRRAASTKPARRSASAAQARRPSAVIR